MARGTAAAALLAAAALAMAAAPAVVEGWWQEAGAQLRREQPTVNWMHVRSPLLPRAWPPAGEVPCVRYHHAAGAERDLHDAVRVAGPFAAELVRRDGSTERWERLPGAERGTQGVQPLTGALDGYDLVLRAEALCRTLRAVPADDSPEARTLRAHFKQWISGNGVLAGWLRPRHRAFLEWVERAPQ